jgi:predicted deacylase
MQTTLHPLHGDHATVHAHLTSYHFGQPGQRKAYIQASLHADEVPAMLVAHCLRTKLQELEQAGRITGEVILVPAANPLGLAQVINEKPHGRFDLATGINFNRGYPDFIDRLKTLVAAELGADEAANVAIVRRHLRNLVDEWRATTDVQTLKKALLGMAIDADIVLDLHCDCEAALHLYTGTRLVDDVMPLANLMQACAVLHTEVAGGDPFDEACSRLWWELADHFGPAKPLPCACVAVTVELRGEVSVDYDTAERDADAILQYLAGQGLIALAPVDAPPACAATPLEGTERIDAPHAGMVVYLRALGERVRAGEAIADLIDPVSGHTTPLTTSVDGVFFGRLAHRYVIRGMNVAKVAGAHPIRHGNLLSL